MKTLENKIALVTSSTRGIGKACAFKLAEHGAKVYLAVRRLDAGKETALQIKNAGGAADVVYFDATQTETYRSMVLDVLKKEHRLDILVNNYGSTDVTKDFDIVRSSYEDFSDILNRNLRSVFEPCQEAVKAMIKTGGGSIINISSIGGLEPDLSRTAYGTAKAAINFLTQDIAVQAAGQNIRCNAVLPGFTQTDAAMDNMSPEFLKTFLSNVPLGRVGLPEDIADAVLFFASDASSYITGQLLPVAGGFGLPTPLYSMYMNSNIMG